MFDGLFQIHFFEQVDCLIPVEGELLNQKVDFLFADFSLPVWRYTY